MFDVVHTTVMHNSNVIILTKDMPIINAPAVGFFYASVLTIPIINPPIMDLIKISVIVLLCLLRLLIFVHLLSFRQDCSCIAPPTFAI